MNIKDYLHLYLGCECLLPGDAEGSKCKATITASIIGRTFYSPEQCTPILRRLSSMTEEEAKEVTGYNAFKDIREVTKFGKDDQCAFIKYRWKDERIGDGNGLAHSSNAVYFSKEEWTPKNFLYLLSRGFDLFGLIDSGLAIEKS